MTDRGRVYQVLLYGDVVGHLAEDDRGAVRFAFTRSYRNQPNRPVLGQWFEDDLARTRVGKPGELPAFFANLVPEGGLRNLVETAFDIEPGDDLGVLGAVGRDLPGAVEVIESDDDIDLGKAPANELNATGTRGEVGGLRFSLAGVQLKFSALRQEDKITLPAKGQRGEWIVKLETRAYPGLVANELSTLEWARAAGFEVPECHIHAVSDVHGLPGKHVSDGGQVLAIKRYDRTSTGSVHQEDFSQVTGGLPGKKYDHVTYEGLAAIVRGLDGQQGYDDFVRRLAFVIATGNHDAHLKNWSLIYPDRVNAQLSPLYDQVCVIAFPGLDTRLALKLGGIKSFAEISRGTLAKFAIKLGDTPDRVTALVMDTIAQVATAWRRIRTDVPMPTAHRIALREHWETVPILRGNSPL
ncbi:MAG TPA: HipA domain-containing protein [Kofleriaceae bacterium]|nr:HipA domain-containing protein [Kofleriaceae bacterium]